jgi:hypothetical protein
MDVESANIGQVSIFKFLDRNTCTFIEVATENGRFYSISEIYYNEHVSFHAGKDSKINLEFHILRSVFQLNYSTSPTYWVLPLSNFISSFMSSHRDLNCHVLRLFTIPNIPEELTDEQKLMVSVRIKEKNRLIIFNFLNRLGFIEPLPDYDTRSHKLLEGKAQKLVTSLMVGEIGSNQIDFDRLKNWFPFQFLNLLGIASGIEVGANWIEFRDDKGRLIRRLHASLNNPRFSRGHKAIDEVTHNRTYIYI